MWHANGRTVMMILDSAKSTAPLNAPRDGDAPPTFEEVVAGSSSSSINFSNLRGTDKPRSPEAATTGGNHVSISPNPPEFSFWDAEYSETSSGDVVSHDAHLNEDGEALYRFLLTQLDPPTFRLRCKGVHVERSTTLVTSNNNNGEATTRTGAVSTQAHFSLRTDLLTSTSEEHTVLVTDFNFYIDLTHILRRYSLGQIWTTSDFNPGYRGEMHKQVMQSPVPETEDMASPRPSFRDWFMGRHSHGGSLRLIGEEEESRVRPLWRAANLQEIKRMSQWSQIRADKGLPPWLPYPGGPAERVAADSWPMRSKMTPREWADDYCQSNKILKEFTFQKVVYGWDFAQLKEAIYEVIRSTRYTGSITVTFETTGKNVHIRPDTLLSRAMSVTWIKVILWILLIYPFLWLFRRFHDKGGGRWQVCGAAYALIRPTPTLPTGGSNGLNMEELRQCRVGVREGEWFKAWEGTIKNAVTTGVKDSQPLSMHEEPAHMLDGYL